MTEFFYFDGYAEPTRPALTWDTTTPFDAFPDLSDWTITSDTTPDSTTPLHPLQRMA